MYQTMQRTLIGVAPLLMNNGRMANPLNEISRSLKSVTGKMRKSDADHELIASLKWVGSLYTTEEVKLSQTGYDLSIECGGRLCVPGENIEAMLAAAAGKKKKTFVASILVDGNSILEYTGPKKVPELLNRQGFRDTRSVVLRKIRIIATRCIIRDWKLPVTIQYLPGELNEREIDEALERAGQIVGLGDYRPKFGRFSVANGKV